MKNSQMKTLLKVLSSMKRFLPLLLLSIIFAGINVALTLYFPILTGDAIDLIIEKGRVDFDGIYLILKKGVYAVLIGALAQWLMNVCNNRMTYGIVRDVRRDAFATLQKLPLKYLDNHSQGDVVSRIIADVDTFADGLLMGFTQLFTGVATILGTLFFMFAINGRIALAVVAITPLSLFVAAFIAKRTFSMFQLQSATRGEQTALINEMIGNQKIVQAFHHEDENLERFDEINERLTGQEISLKLTEAGKNFVIEGGYEPMYGARPLKRFLQKNVETLAAREILSGEVRGGDTIVIDAQDGALVTRIEHGEEQA